MEIKMKQVERIQTPEIVHYKYSNSVESYFKLGTSRFHRLDGPAFINDNGLVAWFIDGKEYFRFKDYLEIVKPLISDEAYLILVLTYGTE